MNKWAKQKGGFRFLSFILCAVILLGMVASPITCAEGQAATEAPTQAATEAPTQAATEAPTQAATEAPTQAATEAPTQNATEAPTQAATEAPTQAATEAPTQNATEAPTQTATEAPTQAATEAPTQAATEAPTQAATEAPTQNATEAPTQAATEAPAGAEDVLLRLESEGMTRAELEQNGVALQTDEPVKIDWKYFEFAAIVGGNQEKLNGDFEMLMPGGVPSGELAEVLPPVLERDGDLLRYHASFATVVENDTRERIYHAGKLKTGGREYVYYVCDKEIDDGTRYRVLREKEDRQETIITVEYQWESANSIPSPTEAPTQEPAQPTHTVEGCAGEGCANEGCACACHEKAQEVLHIEGCAGEGCANEGCVCECHEKVQEILHIEGCEGDWCANEGCACACHEKVQEILHIEGCEGEWCANEGCACACHEKVQEILHIEGCGGEECANEGCACECHEKAQEVLHIEGCGGEGCANEGCACACHEKIQEILHIEGCGGEWCANEGCVCACHEKVQEILHIEGCEGEGCANEGCACECHAAGPEAGLLSEEEILYQLQNGGMTLMALEENGVQLRSVVQDAKIGLEYFNFVSAGSAYTKLNEDMVEHMKEFNEDTEAYVKPGALAETLPDTLTKDRITIAYGGAYVQGPNEERVQIYFVGELVVDGETYIYFVTDKEHGDRTAYSILREGQKILVEYGRISDHKITYQFWDGTKNVGDDGYVLNDGGSPNTTPGGGPGGTTLDDVFGEERVQRIDSNRHAELNVTVPRGYECVITTYNDVNENGRVDEQDGEARWTHTLGGMQKFAYSGPQTGEPNNGNWKADQSTINLANGVTATEYTVTRSAENITSDVIVVCSWKKIEEFTFDAWEWYHQVFAYNRIRPVNADSTTLGGVHEESNYKGTFDYKEDGATYAWYFRGRTVGGITWELDQLEINKTAIDVPMTTLKNEKDPDKLPSETTVLPTGTVVTVTIINWGGENGNSSTNGFGFRDYKIEVSKCYEDITITGGNMVSHTHMEVAMNKLSGVAAPQYYLQGDKSSGFGHWNTLHQNSLAQRRNDNNPYAYTNPFRWKRQDGYYPKVDVTLTNKNGVLIQKNGKMGDIEGVGNNAIEYLVLKSTTALQNLWTRLEFDKSDTAAFGGAPANRQADGYLRGDVDPFQVVSYDQWEESWDGYYYFRMTESLHKWMNKSNPNGVVLLSIEGVPLPGAINYVDGADKNGTDAPIAANIQNMPELDVGGDSGYNCEEHSHVVLPSKTPIDTTGQFVFSHWEALAVTYTDEANKTGTVLDEAYKVDGQVVIFQASQQVELTSAFEGSLSGAFLWQSKDDLHLTEGQGDGRYVITLRAVWIDRSEVDAINYEVRFYVDGVLESTHKHAVPEGATVVTDLYLDYGDKDKGFSQGIQNVLNGVGTNSGKVYTGKYILRDDTTERIESVTRENYIANIYLVRVDMDVSVQKHWDGKPDHDRPSTVAVVLQRQIVGENESAWEMYAVTEENANGGATTDENGYFKLTVKNTNDADSEIKTFKSLPRYVYDAENGKYDLSKQYRYRTLELDPNTINLETLEVTGPDGTVRQLGTGYVWTATCGNNCTYIASYEAHYDDDNNRFITITNTYVGSDEPILILAKSVSGTTNRDAYFTFEITIDALQEGMFGQLTGNVGDKVTYGNVIFTITATDKTDEDGAALTTATATVQLKAGEATFIRNLPGFTQVTIEEKISSEQATYYTTTVDLSETSNAFAQDETNSRLVTGTTGPRGFQQQIIYHNYRAEANDITVTKKVAGNMGDVNKSWQFEITLNEPYTQSFGGISFNPTSDGNGSVGYFSIKAGESKVISGLPDGIGYTIRETEANANGYETTYTKTVTNKESGAVAENYSVQTPTAHPSHGGVSGFATLEYTDEITFTNRKDVLIDNGVTLDSLPYIAILAVAVGGAVWMFIRRRRGRE